MAENKRYTKEVIDTDLLHYVRIKDNGVELSGDEVVDLLNEQDNRIKELQHKLDSLSGLYVADNKEFKHWRLE